MMVCNLFSEWFSKSTYTSVYILVSVYFLLMYIIALCIHMYVLCLCSFWARGSWAQCLTPSKYIHLADFSATLSNLWALLCLSLHWCFLFYSWPSSSVFLPILLSQSDLGLGSCLKPPSIKQTSFWHLLSSCVLGVWTLLEHRFWWLCPWAASLPSLLHSTPLFCCPGSLTALDVKEPVCFTPTGKGSATSGVSQTWPWATPLSCHLFPLITFYSNTCYLLGTLPRTRHRQC